MKVIFMIGEYVSTNSRPSLYLKSLPINLALYFFNWYQPLMFSKRSIYNLKAYFLVEDSTTLVYDLVWWIQFHYW